MRHGRIELHDKSGSFIKSGLYNTPKERSEILKLWRKLYSKAMDKCYIHFIPETNPFGVCLETGKNKLVYKNKNNDKENEETDGVNQHLPDDRDFGFGDGSF